MPRCLRPNTTIDTMFPMIPMMATGIEIQTALTWRTVAMAAWVGDNVPEAAGDDDDDDDKVWLFSSAI